MENELDPAGLDAAQAVSTALEASETETTSEPLSGAEGETPLTTQTKKALPGKAAAKPARAQEQLPPNPLLLDPYDWDRCTITVGYSLLPDQQVSVSVHNHKDEPLVKEFSAGDVPLPEKISGVMAALQHIWPTSPVNTTVVLLPRPENAPERPIIASVRVSTDTPILQEGVESDLPLPAPIMAILGELRALMPERALKNIEKNTKAKTVVKTKTPNRSTTAKPAIPASTPAVNKNIDKSQLTLFSQGEP